jgi:alpha-beta hydrolase superfamily lysophospholipase
MQDHSRYILDNTGRSFFLYEWRPDDTRSARGIVQITHGMMEHAGRYLPLAEYLTDRSFVVVAEDHPGHGKTVTSPKDLGHLEGRKGWQEILDRMHVVMSDAKSRFPNTPYMLLGHSMGSMLARHFAILYGNMLNALILSGPDHTTKPLILTGSLFAGGSTLIYGKHYRNRVLNYLTYKTFNHYFKPNRTPFDWLTTDQGQVDLYVKDPLCGFPSTSGFYQGMFHGLKCINQNRSVRKIPGQLPVLIIAGKNDAVGQFSKGPQNIARQLREAGLKDVTVRIYPEGRHEMHNEKNRSEVFADLAGWMEMKTGMT